MMDDTRVQAPGAGEQSKQQEACSTSILRAGRSDPRSAPEKLKETKVGPAQPAVICM